MLTRIPRSNNGSRHRYKLLAMSFAAFVAVLATARCATEPGVPAGPNTEQRATDQVVATARQPLGDFNVLQGEIPPILLTARIDPYAPPTAEDCRILIAEVRELDRVLGADLDIVQGADPTALRSAANTTFSLARSYASSFASSLVPFRPVTRQITGAERRAREINQAVLAGTVRRAYFKGFGGRLGCEYPGSPRRQNLDLSE